MIDGINHYTLAVSDLHRSFNFFVEIVGLKPIAKWDRGSYLLAGTDWICLSLDSSTRHGPLPEYTHLAFSVNSSSFQERARIILSNGAKIWKENSSEGDSLYFLDPDGHKLELHAGNLETRLASLKSKPYKGLMLY